MSKDIFGILKTPAPKPRKLSPVGSGSLLSEQQYCFEKGWKEGIASFKKILREKINERVIVPDANVQLIWQCEDEDCDSGNPCEGFTPDWFQNNGTPTCNCGRDMKYIRTEVII